MKTFKEFFEQEPCSKEPIAKFHLDQAEKHAKDYFDKIESEENASETVALLAGGFKPPHKGHLEMFNTLLKDADRGVIFIGKKQDRPGREWITPEASRAIWELYTQGGKPVEVNIAPISPVKSTYDYVDENPNANIIIGAGPGDAARNKGFENKEKYPNVSIANVSKPLGGGIRASQMAPLLAVGKIREAVEEFVPQDVIDETNKDAIINILQKDWDNR